MLVLIILLLALPFKIKIDTIKKSRSFYRIHLCFLGVPLICAYIVFSIYGPAPRAKILYRKKLRSLRVKDVFKKQKAAEKYLIRAAVNTVRINKLKIAFSAGNAARTALLSYAADSLLKILAPPSSRNSGFYVQPLFSSSDFSLRINCILSLSLGKILLEYIKLRSKKYASDRKHTANNNV